MRDGDLTTALRASLSAPGMFAPVERDGRLLVDGGIANNVPVDVARAMNVDRLIVVDVGLPAGRNGDELASVTNVANQMLTILIRRESEKQIATPYRPTMYSMSPPLAGHLLIQLQESAPYHDRRVPLRRQKSGQTSSRRCPYRQTEYRTLPGSP